MRKVSVLFLLVGISAYAQYLPTDAKKKIESHITYLASDELEGRLTGSEGEQKALAYISSQ
ncbi:MAG: peptidase M28, partial [Flavobacteriales bacterium]|nr:peptidase M28 [Flavobacteriales bacterium]